MTKAILILNKREYCEECELYGNKLCTGYFLLDNPDEILNCPLKELPKKKNIEDISLLKESSDLYDCVKAYGFNDCLEEILGEDK